MDLGSIVLAIYLGTCAVSFCGNRVLNIMTKIRLKREGYRIRKKKLTLSQMLRVGFAIAFINMFPFLNVLFIRNGIKKRESIYQKTKRDLIANGTLYRPNPIVEKMVETGDAPNLTDAVVINSSDYERIKLRRAMLSAIMTQNIISREAQSGMINIEGGFPKIYMTVMDDSEGKEEKTFQEMTLEEKLEFLKEQRKIITKESDEPKTSEEPKEEDFHM